MRKTLKSVSMLLAMTGLPAGIAMAETVPAVDGIQSIQQAGVCKGVVKDALGETVIGASVVVKGTTNGTITGLDGDFSLNNVNKGDIIEISFVGFTTQTFKWDGQDLIVTLKEDTKVLEEVVITAYGGKQLRTKVTNSISKVKEDVLTKGSYTNPAQALSGAVSGLRVQQTSGNPGSVPTLVLRGGTNLDGSGSPLVIVDGQIRDSMADINPEDIESMEVMKDAGATAIYGARANNGVILITTKRGKEGFSEIRFKAKLGVNSFNDPYTFLNGADYLHYIRKGVQRAAQAVNVGGNYYGWGDMNQLTGVQPFGTGNIYFNSDGTIADGNVTDKAIYSTMKYTDDLAFLLNKGWKTMIDPVYGDELIYKEFYLKDTNIDQNVLTQDYNLSLTGGNEKGNYYLNLGYNDSKGNATGNWYKRFSFTFNGDYKIRKWLTSKTSISFTDAKWFDIYDAGKEDGITNTMGLDYYFSRALSLPPTFRGTNENGDYLYGARWDLSDTITEINLDAYERDNNSNKLNLNQSLVFDLYDGLSLKLTGIWYIFDTNKEYFNKDIYIRYNTVNKDHKSYALHDRTFDQTYNAVLNYDKQITDEHYLSAMAGMEYYDSYRKWFSAYGYGAPTGEFGDLGLTQAEGRLVDSEHTRQRIMSYFGRINYDYMSKYLVSFVIRSDGYSKLIGDNRWGVFPGVSAGWVFGKENFMESLRNVISFAKLRMSYGANGNVSGIGAYDLQGAYNIKKYGGSNGTLLTELPNPGLMWEKSNTFEIGLDWGFLENRYMLNLTYYNRHTKDKFAEIELPSHVGIDKWKTNNGEIQNQGIEVDINARLVNTKDWKFNVSANLAWNKNKIISLPYNGLPNNRQNVFQVYNSNGDLVWVGGYQEGQSPGDIYGFKAEGIYKTDDEVPGNLVDISTPNNGGRNITLLGPDKWAALSDEDKKNINKYLPIKAGDVKWKDVNGDGVIDNYDKVKLGNTMPKVTGGINATLSWKDLTLSARLDYALGHTVVDNKTPWIMGCMQGSYNSIDLTKDSWTESNTNAKYPVYVYADQYGKRNYARDNNSLFVYKGDYLAFRDISLSYNMPKDLITKIGLQSLELSFTAQNLGYLTAAKTMYTPEYGAYSYGGYSIPRSFIFGLNVSF